MKGVINNVFNINLSENHLFMFSNLNEINFVIEDSLLFIFSSTFLVLNKLVKKMSSSQIDQAQELASECLKNDYKGC